ncbi:MAG: hypothetical protein J6R42_01265 [Clostridia bacterium]|nr:hypothetical protein [Clostridia bacterium]
MQKTVIVINGSGGVGKDTLCHMAEKHFAVRNISSIDPIKELASQCGWRGEKNDRARKFLADLKQLTIGYNDYPLRWLEKEYEKFLSGGDQVLFVHIREPQEIEKFVRTIQGKGGRIVTLLIRGGEQFRHRRGAKAYGNSADDEVEKYNYDFYFTNDHPLNETEAIFIPFFESMLG